LACAEAFGSFGEHEKLELRFHDVIEEDQGMVPPNQGDVAAYWPSARDLMQEPPNNAHLLVIATRASHDRPPRWLSFWRRHYLPCLRARFMQEILRIRPKAWPKPANH